MKPRDLAFDKLPPGKQAIVHFTAPLDETELPMVITAKGLKTLQMVHTAEQATITNPSAEEVPYFFAIVPKKLLAVLNADWRALAAFMRSLQQNLLH